MSIKYLCQTHMLVIINYFIPDDIQLGHNSGFDKTVQNSACNIHDNGVQSKGNIYI